MLEGDVQNGGFIHIERRLKPLYNYWSSWSEIGQAAGGGTEYVDQTIYQGCSGNCPDSVQYRIRAEDNTNKFSVYSEPAGKTYYYYKQAANDEAIPRQFALAQNYPKPFNPSTTFRYDLSEDAFVSLGVYDLLGPEVALLVRERQKAGQYAVPFDASRLASGVYLYKLNAGNFSAIRK